MAITIDEPRPNPALHNKRVQIGDLEFIVKAQPITEHIQTGLFSSKIITTGYHYILCLDDS